MIIPDRIAARLRGTGLSQSELARRVGVGQSTINGLVKGEQRSSSHLHKIARELGTSIAYLEGDTDDPSIDALPVPSAADVAGQLDLVGIDQIDLAYGMGASFTDGPIETKVLHFPKAWVEMITSSPPRELTWTTGRGDSMAPTIHDGDLVLLDRSQRRILERDALWAFTVGDLGSIKRLRIKGDRVIIYSDNPTVAPDEEPLEEVHIVARVIFVGKRI
jgi:phage repressor protein C with HTH and peptisase S24 domain